MTKKTTSFAPKDRIDHKVFGTGTILELDRWHTVIAFDSGDTKKFVTSIVKLAPSDTEPPAKPVRKKKKKKTTKAKAKAKAKAKPKAKPKAKAKAKAKPKASK